MKIHRNSVQQTKTKAEKAKKKLTEAKATEEAERVAFCKAEVHCSSWWSGWWFCSSWWFGDGGGGYRGNVAHGGSDGVYSKKWVEGKKWTKVEFQLRRQGGLSSPQQPSSGRSASSSTSSSLSTSSLHSSPSSSIPGWWSGQRHGRLVTSVDLLETTDKPETVIIEHLLELASIVRHHFWGHFGKFKLLERCLGRNRTGQPLRGIRVSFKRQTPPLATLWNILSWYFGHWWDMWNIDATAFTETKQHLKFELFI